MTKITVGINLHRGGHPRKGVVDLIPIHPITEETSLEDCAGVAIRIAQQIANRSGKTETFENYDVDTFFFGHADIPLKRSLVEMRKQVGWYSSTDKGINIAINII